MSNNGYRANLGCLLTSGAGLVLPFVRGSFTGESIVASQHFPVREHYILAYRE